MIRWGSIAALTITIRMCLFPLIVRTLKHNVRLQAVQPQMTALFKRLQEAKTAQDPQAQQVVAQTLTNLMKTHDVSPFRPLLMPLVQMPFFLGMFYALRSLATLPLPQLKEGGLGWVTDLTLADPYYILPITSMLFTNLVLRVSCTCRPYSLYREADADGCTGRSRRYRCWAERQPQHGSFP